MSATDDRKEKFDDMARRLASLYEEGGNSRGGPRGAIYAELRRSGDRYTDAEVLARGGMKKVSRVFDTKTGRHVAMAELRANAPAELYESFLREARLTALLEHPNIITVHDIGLSPEGVPFFTMDLKRGDSLAEVLKKNKVPRERLLEIFVKLCDAISYAHSQKVMHLDLKPENIQVGRFGDVFICDWGLGKIAGTDESEGRTFDQMLFNPDLLNNMTLVGSVKGTPGYMAPEQFETDGVKTYATDVYALGCLLHAILVQRAPFDGTPEEIRAQTLAGKVRPPAAAFPEKHIPKGLNAVVMKALALKPVDRYGTAAELRDEVRNYLSGFATAAENAGFIKEIALFYKRNRAACLVAMGAMGAFVATAGGFIAKLDANIREIQSAHDLAESRRREAETLLVSYRRELASNERLMGSLAGDLGWESFELTRQFIYSDPVKAIQLSLQRLRLNARLYPNVDMTDQIGYRHFIRQEFALAIENWETCDEWYTDLLAMSHDFEQVKSGNLLTVEQLAELMRRLKESEINRRPLMEKMLAHDHAVRKDKTGYELVVEAVLRGWNDWWTQGSFRYDAEKRSLAVRGGRLEQFAMVSDDTSGETPLRFLDIRSLDARNTGLHDLSQIKTLPIQTLDIRSTKVRDLKPIAQFPALRTLIVARNQFADAQLAVLPSTLNVTIH